MKPFNLEEALNGKPVITRDGLKVKEVYLFKNRKSRYCLACLIEDDDIETFTKEGEYFKGKTNILDLFMEEEVFYGFKYGDPFWVLRTSGGIRKLTFIAENKNYHNHIEQGNAFKTKEEAEKEREYRQAKFRLNAKMRELEGDWKADWDNYSQNKYCFYCNTRDNSVNSDAFAMAKMLEDWRFSNKETIEWAIENMQDDIKTILGVE